jgi:hypothetical protein
MNRGLTFTPKKSNLFSHQKTKGTKKKKKKKKTLLVIVLCVGNHFESLLIVVIIILQLGNCCFAMKYITCSFIFVLL